MLLSFSRSTGLKVLHCTYIIYSKWYVRDSPCALRSHDETLPLPSKSASHNRTKNPNWAPTTKIKLIWNLQIYDFNNPFDRTALSLFTFRFFLLLFNFVWIVTFFSSGVWLECHPIKMNQSSHILDQMSKHERMMVLIFTCCFCITAANNEKKKKEQNTSNKRIRNTWECSTQWESKIGWKEMNGDEPNKNISCIKRLNWPEKLYRQSRVRDSMYICEWDRCWAKNSQVNTPYVGGLGIKIDNGKKIHFDAPNIPGWFLSSFL